MTTLTTRMQEHRRQEWMENTRKEGKRKIFFPVIADLWLVDSSIAIGHDEYQLSTVKDH